MTSTDFLITEATLVNEGDLREVDVRIRKGRIETISPSLSAQPGELIVKAEGRWLLPGMIDDQVHFREPGLTHKGDIASESAAAAAGGITSFMDMPNTRPPTLTNEALEAKYERASGRSVSNFGFYLGASHDNLEEIRMLEPQAACGVKVFMGASTGNMLVDDPDTLEAIFRDAPTLVATHCEDTPTIIANEVRLSAELGDRIGPERHPDIRSHQACLVSTRLAVGLARRYGTRLHVLHLTTADELALFEPGPVAGKRITAETCVHFLHFTRADYARLGNLIKCNPAIKDASDRDALLAALIEDRVDIIATDHAPHTLEEKQQPYLTAPAGLPLVQFALVALLELVHEGKLSLPQVVKKTAHAPATLFNVTERGFVREGYWADLVLIDPDRPFVAARSQVLSRCGWSPFEGHRFRSRIHTTWVNGIPVWRDGALTGAVAGRRLVFQR